MIEIQLKSEHSYPIITTSIHSNWVKNFLNEKKIIRVFVLIDENVEVFHSKEVKHFLDENGIEEIGRFTVASGEASKSIQNWDLITDSLLKSGIKRNDAVFIFGGGVTGDLGSFSASTALRGIPVYQFPTTLLAMVDSAIGGKTGINHSTGKNRIGSFYQPEAVICDPDFLKTLPEVEWFCGMGEIIKYACIAQPELEQSLADVLKSKDWRTHPEWTQIIQKSAEIKAKIVQEDEKENGVRANLNFGHTFAHAIESISGYGFISHGVAVFWGCIAAIELSNLIGYDIPKSIEQFIPYYKQLGKIPKAVPQLIQAMYADKKNKSEHLTFIILEKPGKASSIRISNTELVETAWNYLFSVVD